MHGTLVTQLWFNPQVSRHQGFPTNGQVQWWVLGGKYPYNESQGFKKEKAGPARELQLVMYQNTTIYK